jgi:hypothetical protein
MISWHAAKRSESVSSSAQALISLACAASLAASATGSGSGYQSSGGPVYPGRHLMPGVPLAVNIELGLLHGGGRNDLLHPSLRSLPRCDGVPASRPNALSF